MSEGAANEARIVISTNFDTMRDFVAFTEQGLDNIKNKGQSTFKGIGKEAYDFTRLIVGGAFVAAGQDLANAITAPMKKGMSEMIADAEKFRTTITGVAVSAGLSIKGVGKELADLSKHIGEDVANVNAFIESVRAQTGNRKAAIAALPAAKAEALARGYGSASEMAGEVGQLQRRYGLQAGEDIRQFYSRGRAQAKALGLDPNLAAETSKRMLQQYEGAGMSAEAVGRLSNSLLRASGGDMQMALKAGQEFNDIVQGPSSRGQLEKTLGLKQGALLDDKFRPDVGRAVELMQQFQKKRRGQAGLEYVARQHMSPTTAALFSRGMPEIASAMDAQRYVDAGTDLRDAEATYYGSEEGQAQLQRQQAADRDRGAGADLLPYKDKAGEYAGGWGGWTGGRLVDGIGIGGTLYAGGKIAAGLGKKLFGKAAGKVATKAAGGVAARVGLGALVSNPLVQAGLFSYTAGSALDEVFDYSGQAAGAAYEAAPGLADTLGGMIYGPPAVSRGNRYSGPGLGPHVGPPSLSAPASATVAQDPRTLAEEQARRNAEALRNGQAIPVRVVMSAAPTTGQGGQY